MLDPSKTKMHGLVPPPPPAPTPAAPSKRWGRIEACGVFQVMTAPDAPADGNDWREIPSNVNIGDMLVGGAWVPSDKTAPVVRARRDAELAAADKMVWPYLDRGEPVPEALAAYKQALRDVPEQAGFPASVIWPVKP